MSESLRMRFLVTFDNPLVLNGFLPESANDHLRVRVDKDQFTVSIFVSDRTPVDYLIRFSEDPEDVTRHQDIALKELTFEIEAHDVPLEVRDAILNAAPSPATERLGKQAFRTVLRLRHSLELFFRNEEKQHWVGSEQPVEENYDSTFPTTVLHPNGTWRPFHFSRESTILLKGSIYESTVNRAKWMDIKAYIEKERTPRIEDIVTANVLSHLAQDNTRLAVIETVIALEIAIKTLLPKVVLALSGKAKLGSKQIDSLIEKAGLRKTIELALNWLVPYVMISTDDISTALEALATRNEIVHGARKKPVELSDAQRFFHSVQNIIRSFEVFLNQQT